MKLDRLRDMFKGPTGGYDTARVLYAIGGAFAVVAPVAFQAWALYKGEHWDPLAFCTAYGGELSAVLALGGLGIATKDKGVASALNTTAPAPPLGGQP